MSGGPGGALAALVWPALVCLFGCGGDGPREPVVLPPRLPATPVAAPPCSSWPLAKGCVAALAVDGERLCALTRERGFCWGPGAAEVVELSRGERDRLAHVPRGVPTSPGCRLRGPTPEVVVSCAAPSGSNFHLVASKELGVTTANDVDKVVQGREHACALTHGAVVCFGGSASTLRGERGTDRGLSQGNRLALEGVTDLVAHERTTCALASGEVHCWGDGLLFPPGSLERPRSRIVASAFVDGGRSGCLLGAGGELWCGARGDLVRVPELSNVKQIVPVTEDEVCARLADGRVACVGSTGVARDRPSLAPAKLLVDGLPCALLEGGRVRCDAWKHRGEDFPAIELANLGIVKTLTATAVAGGPGACALTEKGSLACWGFIGMSWWQEPVMAGNKVWVLTDKVEKQPVPLPGPKDVVELRGVCARTRNDRVWALALANQAKDPKRLRLAASTDPGADRAVELGDAAIDGCVGRRADGSAFVLRPRRPAFGPALLGPPQLEPFASPDEPELDAGLGPATFVMGSFGRFGCTSRRDAGAACREREGPPRSPERSYEGPVFDPLFRSTLPLRVIPPLAR